MTSVNPIALTPGDPGGIGIETSLKAWQAGIANDGFPVFFLMHDYDAALKQANMFGIPITKISTPDQARAAFKSGMPVLNIPLDGDITLGRSQKDHANFIISGIDKAVQFVQNGAVRAIVTNPITKHTLYDAGFTYGGHTEYLAHLDECQMAAMMLAIPTLRVVPVTIHIPLKDVAEYLTADLIYDHITLTHNALRQDFGLNKPRLAIAGLNPHAGENGKIGIEEQKIIQPAIARAKDQGLDVSNALPADTLFHEDARRKYDAVICMYHDQALIPLKTLNFWQGVNITLGLSFIRTSPDHGVGLDIAGQNIAKPDSLQAAIQKAALLSANRYG